MCTFITTCHISVTSISYNILPYPVCHYICHLLHFSVETTSLLLYFKYTSLPLTTGPFYFIICTYQTWVINSPSSLKRCEQVHAFVSDLFTWLTEMSIKLTGYHSILHPATPVPALQLTGVQSVYANPEGSQISRRACSNSLF